MSGCLSLYSNNGWLQSLLTDALSWLSAHGFILNNREIAALTWLIIIALLALWSSDVRQSVSSVLEIVLSLRLIPIWIVYGLWILAIVEIASRAGIWRTTMAKDTLVWSLTAGIALLLESTDALQPGYFQRAAPRVLSVVVIAEAFFNLAIFPFWIEFILQPVLFIMLISPIIVQDTNVSKGLHQLVSWFPVVLVLVIAGYVIQTVYQSWQTLKWGTLALQAVWPILLGIWVLLLVFPLAIVMGYETAFRRLSFYRDKQTGLWKVQLGLVLALGIRPRWVREAAKGGTNQVANAESVMEAYEAAKQLKN